MSSTAIHLFGPGIIAYDDAWDWQRATAAAVRDGTGPEYLALLQHPPVFTLGRRTKPEHLLATPEDLAERGASVVECDRGGDVTFHGAGQLVGYPILDLRARGILPGDYVRMLEQTLIDALEGFGIAADRVPGRPGVWAGGGKIAAIGVRVQGGVTTHGFALNVNPDLAWFEAIVPCGLADAAVTSMAMLLTACPAVGDVEASVAQAFERIFGVTLIREPSPPASEPASRVQTLASTSRGL